MKKPMTNGIILSLIFVLLFSLPVNAQTAGQDPLPNLFAPSSHQPRSSKPDNPEIIRWRPVEIDFVLLQQAARNQLNPREESQPSFVFNLFEDTLYQAEIDAVHLLSGGSIGMTGHLDSTEVNEFVLVSRGDILHLIIQDGGSYYEVRYDGLGHVVAEVDPEQYADPQAPDFVEYEGPAPQDPGGTASELSPLADSADEIEVLAVYTAAAKAAVGGQAAMETRIQASILSTNQGYAASGINQQVRLVGMEEVNYDETDVPAWDSSAWYYALYRLTFGHYDEDLPDANYLADARAFRETYGADLVFMVSALPSGICGIGWLGGAPDEDYLGYSVDKWNCTGSTAYTVQHELGHNMGACHDRANNSNSGCWDLTYSYGYQKPNQFYTVMAYSNGCGNCIRLNRWSNPNQTYNGYPLGVPLGKPNAAFNTLTLNNTAANVANYRQSVNPISASFVSPMLGSSSMIPRTILNVNASSSEGSIVRVTYSVHYDGAWHTVRNDTNGADGWDYLWPTYQLSEQLIDIQVEVEDSAGYTTTINLWDVPLSRSQSFGAGYSTRQNDIREGENEDTGGVQSAPPDDSILAAEPVEDASKARRFGGYHTIRRFLLY
ncbi:MAG TPA: M12 family metallo-peptidase [Anaerolineales bacterium]|nr:M12 family metallo-peptidase [Anaerolineales bacterium]